MINAYRYKKEHAHPLLGEAKLMKIGWTAKIFILFLWENDLMR